jgi:UDP-4-amino-4,6-dideoxy-N-acetyl-beta-L-altrosamine N-acetyltransferase
MTSKPSIAELAAELTLTPLAECDAETVEGIRRIRNEPSVRANMYTDHEISAEEHARWVASLAQNARSRFFGVFWQGALVGGVSLSALDATHARADWAFYLHPDTRGKRLGTALELRFLDFAFGEAGLLKLNCEVLDFNEPVVAMHKRFGFVEEGRRRQHIRRAGKTSDAVLLGITREEWHAARAAIVG